MVRKLLFAVAATGLLSVQLFGANLSGSWVSGGKPDKVCGILHQDDSHVTIIDEDRYRGYGKIVGQTLVITNYSRPGAAKELKATISGDGTRLDWPGNSWSRKANGFQIWLLDKICHSQNESGPLKGDDEMYIVRNEGNSAAFIGEWHDFDRGKRQQNILLWDGTIENGQAVELSFVVMEEDDDKDVFVKALGEALKRVEGEGEGPDIARAVGQALSALASLAKDPDDHIGTFGCKLQRDKDGVVKGKWSAGTHCRLTNGESKDDPHASTLEVSGDDAKYELWLYPMSD
jgi:hypothetical protein